MTDEEKLFWTNWEKTKLGSFRCLSRKQIQDYYDYFSGFHYRASPETIARDLYVAAEDRMVALQSELEFRRTRDIQVFVATIGAVVLIGVGVFQRNRPCNGNANPEHPKTQIAPAQPVSSSQPTP